MRRGLPYVYLGKARRIDPVAADRWLAAANNAPAVAANTGLGEAAITAAASRALAEARDAGRLPAEPSDEVLARVALHIRAAADLLDGRAEAAS
jgi:hypothetical protein